MKVNTTRTIENNVKATILNKIKDECLFQILKANLYDLYKQELLSFNEWYSSLVMLCSKFNKTIVV